MGITVWRYRSKIKELKHLFTEPSIHLNFELQENLRCRENRACLIQCKRTVTWVKKFQSLATYKRVYNDNLCMLNTNAGGWSLWIQHLNVVKGTISRYSVRPIPIFSRYINWLYFSSFPLDTDSSSGYSKISDPCKLVKPLQLMFEAVKF